MKQKLEQYTKNNAINLFEGLKQDDSRSEDTIDLPKRASKHNSSLVLSRASNRHNTCKQNENTFINNNDFSLFANESDHSMEKSRNKSDFFNKTEEFSFRSQDISKNTTHFDLKKHNYSETFIKVNDEETKKKLDLIKIKTNSLLNIYQKKIESLKKCVINNVVVYEQ